MFVLFISYKSDHNQKVREKLVEHLRPKFGDTHSPGRIKSKSYKKEGTGGCARAYVIFLLKVN